MSAPADDEIWLFLGDSLTEGIGDRRDSWPAALAARIRAAAHRPVHHLSLRTVDFSGLRDAAHFDIAGRFDADPRGGPALWLVNLAAEATTVADDAARAGLLASLNAHRVFILRGPLETIIRPAPVADGAWPRWIPRSWRGYAAMDPRCHFSGAPWRGLKQRAVDHARQTVRLRLLRAGGAPLMATGDWLAAYRRLVAAFAGRRARVTLLALPPVSPATFPATRELVDARNRELAALAAGAGAGFLDWSADLAAGGDALFCRDGFHPNAAGAARMAALAHARLCDEEAPHG